MEGLRFPKPVKAEKKRKQLKSHPRKPTTRLPIGGVFPKGLIVKDPALLKRYEGQPCVWPGCHDTFDTHAHHIVPRSKQQLDIEQNLMPLCLKHHRMVEEGATQPGTGVLVEALLVLVEKTVPSLKLLYSLTPTAGIWRELPEAEWLKICG